MRDGVKRGVNMDVPMELSRILITELGHEQLIFLKEKDGSRSFPIMIGINEALAIDRRLKGVETPRPMTHDLLAGVIEAMGGELEKIVINDIRKVLQDDTTQTFIATIYIRKDDELIEVDSRPSDAIALGSAMDTPIYVSEHVLDNVLNKSTSREERIEMLRNHLESLAEKISELSDKLSDDEFLESAPSPVIEQARRRLEEMKSEYEAIEQVLKKLG